LLVIAWLLDGGPTAVCEKTIKIIGKQTQNIYNIMMERKCLKMPSIIGLDHFQISFSTLEDASVGSMYVYGCSNLQSKEFFTLYR